MTGPSDGRITTEAEFKAALTTVLQTAHENGIRIEKPWLCQTDDGFPDWEAAVVRLDGSATDED
ncbi:hypothetical protein [Halomicrobium katesii]|uniref:hypothetical protein n=1 Tax=Halomicrobium katesii TaxID=437163 RepID=UPI00037D58BB|nr:hypothetical protein [Halomicrobium katesii]